VRPPTRISHGSSPLFQIFALLLEGPAWTAVPRTDLMTLLVELSHGRCLSVCADEERSSPTCPTTDTSNHPLLVVFHRRSCFPRTFFFFFVVVPKPGASSFLDPSFFLHPAYYTLVRRCPARQSSGASIGIWAGVRTAWSYLRLFSLF